MRTNLLENFVSEIIMLGRTISANLNESDIIRVPKCLDKKLKELNDLVKANNRPLEEDESSV